jgi:hypothetical protein
MAYQRYRTSLPCRKTQFRASNGSYPKTFLHAELWLGALLSRSRAPLAILAVA